MAMQSTMMPHPGQNWQHPGMSNYGHKKQKTAKGPIVTQFPRQPWESSQGHLAYGGWQQYPLQPLQYGFNALQPGVGSLPTQYATGTMSAQPYVQPSAYPPYMPAGYNHQLHTTGFAHGQYHMQPPTQSPVSWQGQSNGYMPHSVDAQYQQDLGQDHVQGDSHPYVGQEQAQDLELQEDDEEYCEFTRPCPHNLKDVDIDKKFSLGLVILRTARPANSALPAVWHDANPDPNESAKVVPFEPDKCPSHYHSEQCKEETLRPVRDSSDWENMKQDPIYKTFSASPSDIFPLAQLRATYAMRPAPAWPLTRRTSDQSALVRQQQKSLKHSVKRVFSQTEHATDHTQNKRHRSDQFSRSNSKNGYNTRDGREAQTQTQKRKGGRAGGQPSDRDDIPTFKSKLKSDDKSRASSRDKSMSTAAHDHTSGITATVTEKPILPATSELDAGAENAVKNDAAGTALLNQDSTDQSLLRSSNDRPHAAATPAQQLVDSPNPPSKAHTGIKESAWTRLARQYQADAARELDMLG